MSKDVAWGVHEELVKWTTWRIVKRYGGDFEECYSQAIVHFLEAIHLYQPCKGSLSNWIHYKVYKELQETKRTQARRLGYTGALLDTDKVPIVEKRSWLDGLVKLLSEEAKEALFVILTLDEDFHNKSLYKLKARQLLREQGYKNKTITSCFKEIEAALT